jgi:DNA polymerase-3 subunit alpha
MMQKAIDTRNGTMAESYLHEDLRHILEVTGSALVYQEQVIEICRDIAGLSLEDSDAIRKGVGKKLIDVLEKCSKIFMDGCASKRYSRDLAEKVWGWIIEFAGYGFNKSHGICYSHISYYTAWMKTHYPLEFFTACLCECGASSKEQTVEIHSFVNDAKLFGIKVLPPSVSRPNMDFEIVNNSIAFGLGHIKGVGEKSLSEVDKCRTSCYNELLRNFIELSPKKTVVEALIWSGAFDELGVSRWQIAADAELIRSLSNRELEELSNLWSKNDASAELLAYVEGFADESDIDNRKARGDLVPNVRRRATLRQILKTYHKNQAKFSLPLQLAMEKFYLGIAISGNETDIYEGKDKFNQCVEFVDAFNNERFNFLCLIKSVRTHTDKNGNQMAFVKVEDSSYALDNVVVFASTYSRFGNFLQEGEIVTMKGNKKGNSFFVNKVGTI